MENFQPPLDYPIHASGRNSERTLRSPHALPPRLERLRRSLSGTSSSRRSEHERRRRRVMTQPHTPTSPDQSQSSSKRRRLENQGQIELAQLQLELQSCDGGKYDGGRYYTSADYCPENVLRNDSSVYCTVSPRCNMIFRHVGEKCFTLQRLVIRAPPTGYTAPVREGMIFVTMDSDDLIARTNYTITHDYNAEDEDQSSDLNENDLEDQLNLFESEPCDTGRDEDDLEPVVESFISPGRFHRIPNVHASASTSGGGSGSLRGETIALDQTSSTGLAHLEPNATFYNKERRTKCTINFDPAISGRYILAKFFSANMRDNIDIEFIGAYGYVGSRFFPAITPR